MSRYELIANVYLNLSYEDKLKLYSSYYDGVIDQFMLSSLSTEDMIKILDEDVNNIVDAIILGNIPIDDLPKEISGLLK